ncbi:MAG: hypothetical protein ACT4PI_12540 [Actinomycetota bacterium]
MSIAFAGTAPAPPGSTVDPATTSLSALVTDIDPDTLVAVTTACSFAPVSSVFGR